MPSDAPVKPEDAQSMLLEGAEVHVCRNALCMAVFTSAPAICPTCKPATYGQHGERAGAWSTVKRVVQRCG